MTKNARPQAAISAAEQKLARRMQHLRAVDKNEGDIDVSRRGFRGFRQRAEDDLLGLAADHFQNRRPLDPLLLHQPPEDRRFKNAEPDVEADAGHDDAEQKRNAPAPNQELVAGKPTEKQHRRISEQQSGRHAELRARGDEAAVMLVRAHSIASSTEPPHSPPMPMP